MCWNKQRLKHGAVLLPLLSALIGCCPKGQPVSGAGGVSLESRNSGEPGAASRPSPDEHRVVLALDGGSPETFARTVFAEQRLPKPVLECVRLPTGRHALRLTARESCTGSWRVPFKVVEKTRYRVECEVSVEPGAEMGNQSLVVEHNLGGCVIRPWSGTTNIVLEISSQGEDNGLLQYRLRGFKGSLVFSKVVVSQVGAEGAEPAPLYDQASALFHETLYRYAVPGDQPVDALPAGWSVDPVLTQKLKEAVANAAEPSRITAVPGFQLVYALTDQRRIPSAYPERLEEHGVLAITLLRAPAGSSDTDGDRYYQVTLHKPFSWVPSEGAKTERGAKKRLLNREGHRLHLYLHERDGALVEYGVGTPQGETVFYKDRAGRPVLPANDVLASLPLPAVRRLPKSSGTATTAWSGKESPAELLRTGQLLAHASPQVPLGGILDWQYRSRELDRRLLLLGARQGKPARFPKGRVIMLDTSLRIGITAKACASTPDFLERVAASGANLLICAEIAPGVSRAALETAPFWICGLSPLVLVDEFDAYRSQFLSVKSFIDEPFERSTDWDEYVRKHEVRSWDDLARLFPERIRLEGLEKRSFFPGEPVCAFDTLPSMADLHFRAGVSAFWFEHYAPERTAADLLRCTGETFKDSVSANRACFAPMRGAAFQHGRAWGIGVWVTEPLKNSCGGGQWESARATLLQAWREGARDLIFYSESAAATTNACKWARLLRGELAAGQRSIPVGGSAAKAILVRPGFLGGGKFGLRTYPPLDTESNRRMWAAFNRQFAAYANAGEAFDILVDDAPRDVLEHYTELWRLNDHL